MKKLILSCVLIIFVNVTYAQQSITTLILVRHAEKAEGGGDDPELKSEGVDRAKKLSEIFYATSIDAVYSTKFKRTKSTVAPVAQQKGKEVLVYDNIKPETVDEILKKHYGKTVLIGGHSNTIPALANQLLGTTQFQNFADSDYSNIIIVSVVEKGKVASFTLLKY